MTSRPSNVLVAVIVSALVSLVVALLTISSLSSDGRQHQNDLYAQIQSSGTIRAAYAVGAPLFIIDPNTGQKSGIFYDIVNKAAGHLGLNVEWTEEVGYGEMIQGLNDHRYEVIGSGVWINASRGKGADFTIPLYYDAVYAYTKVGDTRFDKNLSHVNSPDFIISTMDGELGADIAKTDFPNAKTLELPQNASFSQLILNVLAGKADVVFLAAAPARDYQRANPGQILAIDPTQPVRIFPNAIMIPQGQYELKQALDYALLEMLNNGEVDAILSKYESAPGVFLRVALPYQPASSR